MKDNSSIEVLWRGTDAAKFTALQAALGDEGIQFWHAQTYDPAGGFLSSRPFYMEAMPGFEIRVHAADLQRARDALAWVESNAETSAGAPEPEPEPEPKPETNAPAARPSPSDHWNVKGNVNEATDEIWAGEDEAMAEYLASALRENGIPSRIPDEPGTRVRLCVRPGDVARARKIAGEISGATPSA